MNDQTINEIIERLSSIEKQTEKIDKTISEAQTVLDEIIRLVTPQPLPLLVQEHAPADDLKIHQASNGENPAPAPAPEQPADQKPASRVERMFGKREDWKAGNGRTPVKGFLHLTCPDCGNSFTTFLKTPKDVFYCRTCGGKIPLDFYRLRKFRAACHKCGDSATTYRTNSNDTTISVTCRNCGAEIYGVLHRLRDEYETI